VALPIRSLSNVTVRLESLGPDDRHTIHPEDWVEIVDDRLIGRAGELWQVDVVNTDDRTATLRRRNGREPLQLAGDDRHHHPLLRRWDHSGDAKVTLEGGIPLTEASGEDDGSWIRLEEGIQIQFGGGRSYRAGDYWLVPARTATGDVLWPVERDDNGAVVHRQGNAIAAPLPPHGVEHHYAPIGLVRFRRDGAFESHDDLRRIVERLAR
jgi:hypothetical protein